MNVKKALVRYYTDWLADSWKVVCSIVFVLFASLSLGAYTSLKVDILSLEQRHKMKDESLDPLYFIFVGLCPYLLSNKDTTAHTNDNRDYLSLFMLVFARCLSPLLAQCFPTVDCCHTIVITAIMIIIICFLFLFSWIILCNFCHQYRLTQTMRLGCLG